jgi:hypothetical protein
MSIPLQCFLVMNLSYGDSSASVARWLALHSWTLNWAALTLWTELDPSSHTVSERTHREHRRITSSVVWRHRARACCGRYITTAVRVTYRDTSSIVACGHYLATTYVYRFTSWQRIYTPQYDTDHIENDASNSSSNVVCVFVVVVVTLLPNSCLETIGGLHI